MDLLHFHHKPEQPIDTGQCEHWIVIGTERWDCTNQKHNTDQPHFNNVIHAEWW